MIPRLAFAFGTAMLVVSAAQAGPAEELAGYLDSLGPGLDYAAVEATDDGGVVVRGLALTAAYLQDLPYSEGDAGDLAASPTALSIDSLQLSEGVVVLLLGTSSGAEQGPLGFAIDGFLMDLTAMAGSHEADLLREYLGADRIEGAIKLWVEGPPMGRQVASVDIALDPIADVVLRIEFDDSTFELPSGELRVTDTPEHGHIAFGAYLERLALEAALEMGEMSTEMGYPDAPDAAAMHRMRADLAALPTNGPDAAAELAAWAEEMAAALPEHAAVLDAIRAFASGPGTLRIAFAPPDPAAELVYDMSDGPELDPTPEEVARAIETLGITAEFEPAE